MITTIAIRITCGSIRDGSVRSAVAVSVTDKSFGHGKVF